MLHHSVLVLSGLVVVLFAAFLYKHRAHKNAKLLLEDAVADLKSAKKNFAKDYQNLLAAEQSGRSALHRAEAEIAILKADAAAAAAKVKAVVTRKKKV